MILGANLSVAQTGVGYQFYDANGLTGTRITAGITSPRPGIYVAASAAPPAGTVGVYWDCADAQVYADEFLADRILAETNLDVTVSSRSSHSAADIWSVGTRSLTTFGTLIADMVIAVWAATTRTLTAFGFSTGATAQEISDQITSDHGAGSYVTALSEDAIAALEGADQILLAELFVPEEAPQLIIPALPDDTQTAGYLHTKDGEGNIDPGAVVHFQLVSTSTPGAYSKRFNVSSDGDGLLVVPLVRSSTYRARRGFRDEDWKSFTTTDTGTYEIPPIIGLE